MDLPDLEPWAIPTAAAQVQRSSRGTNNDVRIVRTTQGRLVWRRYENLSARQVLAEHRLLQWLDSRELPFSVPVPLRTTSGTTFAELPDGGVASVHAFIPGDRPNDTDREIALTATAFAQLLLTLADAPPELAPRDWSTTRLCDIHPGLPAPEELLARLAKHDVDVGWLADTLDAERDLQAGEIEVLPGVVRQRLAGSVLWRTGRWLQGRSDVDEVVSRVRDGAEHVAHLGSYRPTVRSHRSA